MTAMAADRATVVTGLGVAAPNGIGRQRYWEATLAGRSGIGPITRFDASGYPTRLAGEVGDFVPEDWLPSRLLPQTDHMTRLALVSADLALADAAVDPSELPEYEMGVVTASSAGGFEFGQRELQNLWSKGSDYVSAYQSFAWFYAVNTGQISIRNGMRGPSGVLVSDQAGGLDAVAHARRNVRKGIELVVTGGVDGLICPWGWVAEMTGGRTSVVADPSAAYLPFDGRAAGHVPGEGGAILILQDAESALRHGIRQAYGEIAGYAATVDPAPGSGREPGLRRAIEGALRDAGTSADQIDVVFADGAANRALDQVEARALVELFGSGAVPVTIPKTMTGRLYAGTGSLDLATALLSLRDQVIPPTINVHPDGEHGLDLVLEQRHTALDVALVVARGSGFNAAMVVREPGRAGFALRSAHEPFPNAPQKGEVSS